MKTEIIIRFEDDGKWTYDEAVQFFELRKNEENVARKFIGDIKVFRYSTGWQISQEAKLKLRISLKMLWVRFLNFIN